MKNNFQEIRINMHDQKGGGVRLGGVMGPKGILMGGDRSLGRDGLPPLSHQSSTMQLLPHHSMSNLQGTGNGPGQQGIPSSQHAQYGPPHNHLPNQQYQHRDQQAREMQQHMMQQKHQRQAPNRGRGGNAGDLFGIYIIFFYILLVAIIETHYRPVFF